MLMNLFGLKQLQNSHLLLQKSQKEHGELLKVLSLPQKLNKRKRNQLSQKVKEKVGENDNYTLSNGHILMDYDGIIYIK